MYYLSLNNRWRLTSASNIFFFFLSFLFLSKWLKKQRFHFEGGIISSWRSKSNDWFKQRAWIITLFRVENSRVIRFIIFDLVFSNTLQLTDRGIVGQLVIGRITERAESGVTRSKGRWLSTRQMIERRFRQTTTCSVQIDNCLF